MFAVILIIMWFSQFIGHVHSGISPFIELQGKKIYNYYYRYLEHAAPLFIILDNSICLMSLHECCFIFIFLLNNSDKNCMPNNTQHNDFHTHMKNENIFIEYRNLNYHTA